MVKVYGKDRTIASKIRQLWATSIGEGFMENIEDIDRLVSPNEVNLESYDNVGETTSKVEKRKT